MIQSSSDQFDFYIRENQSEANLSSCTHLAIGAHPDDLEVMAAHGILEGLKEGQEFVGVICSHGGGSPQNEDGKITQQDLILKRRSEQIEAAQKGSYLACFQLGYDSSQVKDPKFSSLQSELSEIIKQTQPDIIYCHNPMDKHATHVAVCAHLIDVLKKAQYKPQAFYGCEVWRGLDWVEDQVKVSLPIENVNLVQELIAVFESQIGPGKNYVEATIGRMRSNATYRDANQMDEALAISYAVDLLPLLNSDLDLKSFSLNHIEKLNQSIVDQLDRL